MSKNKHIIHLLNEVVTERSLKMPWPNTSDQHVSVKDEDELRLLDFLRFKNQIFPSDYLYFRALTREVSLFYVFLVGV